VIKLRTFVLALLIASASPGYARVTAEQMPALLQLYTYRLKDRASFEKGYRDHLGWHVRQKDRLVWYAWMVESGARRGLFIDGTAGVTFGQLDGRPDPSGDAADFARTAAAHAEAVNVETWELWNSPSTETPLEELKPPREIDVFHIYTTVRDAQAFETAVDALGKRQGQSGPRITWYRLLRGGKVPAYMLMVSRERWADIDAGSRTLSSALSAAYQASPGQVQYVLNQISSVETESWGYAPRLSLMPGAPLSD
jgi:hypothetical protein